jgi:Zn-dependent protease
MFGNTNLNQIVVMVVPLLFSVTIHEVAHGYIALRMGDHTAQKAGRLTLNTIKHLDFFWIFALTARVKIDWFTDHIWLCQTRSGQFY